MDTGAILGIVFGVIVFVLILGFLVYMYWWKPYSMKKEEFLTSDKVRSKEYKRKLLDMYNIEELYDDQPVEMDGTDMENQTDMLDETDQLP